MRRGCWYDPPKFLKLKGVSCLMVLVYTKSVNVFNSEWCHYPPFLLPARACLGIKTIHRPGGGGSLPVKNKQP